MGPWFKPLLLVVFITAVLGNLEKVTEANVVDGLQIIGGSAEFDATECQQLRDRLEILESTVKSIVIALASQKNEIIAPITAILEQNEALRDILSSSSIYEDIPENSTTHPVNFNSTIISNSETVHIDEENCLVNLKDNNDNAPFFPHGVYFGNVTENGTAGMVVMTMTAVNYDDPNEGSNAKLTYSIEKNVMDEKTGMPIFEIESETGVIKTAVPGLDREKTPNYSIQVVAMDGKGLKGTGTASIRVKDINDMPPKFTKSEWYTEVDETDGIALPDAPILTVTVHDEDETNKFHYKVIESSGFGADKFTMVRNNDGTGSLKVVQPLDYEDKLQKHGFRFMIQVNDKGEDNDNDNLETFRATDPDQGGKSKISFAIDRATDRRRQFAINQNGIVTIQRHLNRDDTPRHQVRILAIDDGVPPKTATATLTVIVKDINDNQAIKPSRNNR
uniref:Cadherin domain-containing protein n=1 Tax=Daphnia galeata TaxID=27404 RepID=A0A8J2RTD4_9CRUS|nr:unnamed protein product [Daphnia galeata]